MGSWKTGEEEQVVCGGRQVPREVQVIPEHRKLYLPREEQPQRGKAGLSIWTEALEISA
jgi:hypothetical protein